MADSAIKVVLMGQGGVGKTAMTLRFTTGEFNEQYLPTIGDMYTSDVEVNGAPRHIQLDDTAGQEAYADLRAEKLGTGDGYLLVYSTTDDSTFGKLDRLREAILEAQRAAGKPAPPIHLVGTKSDLAGDRAVTAVEAAAKAKEWGSQHFELSSKTGTGVREAFMGIVGAVLSTGMDPSKGSGGGSVLGAGKTPARHATAPKEKKTCTIF